MPATLKVTHKAIGAEVRRGRWWGRSTAPSSKPSSPNGHQPLLHSRRWLLRDTLKSAARVPPREHLTLP
jgi:hypothetical protein